MASIDPLWLGAIDRMGYDAVRLLAAGGMADLVLVKKGSEFVFKFLKAEYEGDPEYVRRFISEAKRTSSITHPNVVRIYEFEENERADVHYYVMDYMAGGTLQDRLKREGRLSVSESVAVATQVAQALVCAHEQTPLPIVHRDIKPSNILFDRQRIVVSDFGIAKAIGGETKMTTFGQVVGSGGYMSPEQLRGQIAKIDARTDIYALGCVLYRMLTGREVFTGDTEAAVTAQHLMKPVVPPASWEADVPGWLSGVVVEMLEKEPDRRPASMRLVAELLEGRSDSETLDHFSRIHRTAAEAFWRSGDEEVERTRIKPAPNAELSGELAGDEAFQRLCSMWSQYLTGMGVAVGGMPGGQSVASCPRCNAILNPTDKVCTKCGVDVASLRRNCPKCKAPYLAGQKFCGRCKRALIPPEVEEAEALHDAGKHEDAAKTLGEVEGLPALFDALPKELAWIEEMAAGLVLNLAAPATSDAWFDWAKRVLPAGVLTGLRQRFQEQERKKRVTQINRELQGLEAQRQTIDRLRLQEALLNELISLGEAEATDLASRVGREIRKITLRNFFVSVGVLGAALLLFALLLALKVK